VKLLCFAQKGKRAKAQKRKRAKGHVIPATSSSVITAYSLGRIAGQITDHLYRKFGVC
jgi:hypothetical protein